MDGKKLLKSKKKKHPKFLRQNYGRIGRKRVKDNWRRPRGQNNKKRIKIKTFGALPKIGYKNPDSIRGMHPSGVFEMLVSNKKEVDIAKQENYGAIRIRANVSKRNKALLSDYAVSLGLKVLNKKDKQKQKPESKPKPEIKTKKE